MKLPFFNVYFSYQEIQPLIRCAKCKTVLTKEGDAHDCDRIALRNLIKKRVLEGTFRNTIVCGILGLLLGAGILIWYQHNIISSFQEVISYTKSQMAIMDKVTGAMLDANGEVQTHHKVLGGGYVYSTNAIASSK